MAELAAGPHATDDPAERARRQDRLQRVEATFDLALYTRNTKLMQRLMDVVTERGEPSLLERLRAPHE